MRLKNKLISRVLATTLIVSMLLSNTYYGFAEVLPATTTITESTARAFVEKTDREKTEILVKMRGGSSAEQTAGGIKSPSTPDFNNMNSEDQGEGTDLSAEKGLNVAEASSSEPKDLNQIVSKVKGKLKLSKTKIKHIEVVVKKENAKKEKVTNEIDKVKHQDLRSISIDTATTIDTEYAIIEIDKDDDIDEVVSELSKYSEIEYAQPNYPLAQMEAVTEPSEPAVTDPPVVPTEDPAPTDAIPPATETPPLEITPPTELTPPTETTTPPVTLPPVEITTPTASITPALTTTPSMISLIFDGLENLFTFQWGLSNVGQNIKEIDGIAGIDIQAMVAWATTKGSSSVIVGILDTGIDISHEDLSDSIYINNDEIPGNGIDDDENGYVDDVNGWDFSNDDSSVYDSPADDTHGTHVAGIIAASDNDFGISGVAPGVKVLPLKFMKDSIGYTSDAIEAIQYADSLGVEIMNCSFGSIDNNYALQDAMENADMIFVCAAGNNGQNSKEIPVYPANFKLGNVISVGAVDNTGRLADYSNYGETVSIAAPGSDIVSTIPDNGYDYQSGTSSAAAFVSGTAALVKSIKNEIRPKELRQLLIEQVTILDTLDEKVATGGITDASKAVDAEIPTVIDVVNPSEQIMTLLKNVAHVSELGSNDLKALSDIFKVDTQAMLDMDRFGYPMEDLTALLLAIYRCDIGLESGKAIINAIDDPTKCLERLREYEVEILFKSVKFQSDTQMIMYVGGEEKLEQVYTALIVSGALDIELERIIRKPGAQSDGERAFNDAAYISLTEGYYIDINEIIEYQKSSGLTWSEILEKVKTYQEKVAPTFAPFEGVFDKYSINYANYLNTTFKVGQSSNESIDPVTGALKVAVPLFEIQGKTGAIPVALEYASDESQTLRARPNGQQASVTYWENSNLKWYLSSYWMHWSYQLNDANGVTIEKNSQYSVSGAWYYDEIHGPDSFVIDRMNALPVPENWEKGHMGERAWVNYDNRPVETHSTKTYQIGYGWGLSLPSFELSPNDGLLGREADEDRYWTMHVDGKQIPVTQRWYQERDRLEYGSTQFKQYKIEIVEPTVFTNGESGGTSHFVLNYLDGRKAYFNNDGRLIGMEDTFGNKTVFKYLSTNTIREITDCYGNTTTLSYTGTGSDKTITVTMPDGSNVVLLSQGGLLKKVTDQEGRVTSFDEYDVKTTKGHFNTRAEDSCQAYYNWDFTGDIYDTTYNLLKKVTYPTAASTVYEYTEAKRINRATIAVWNAGPYEGFFQVTRRYDKASSVAPQSNGSSFTYGNYTNYVERPAGAWADDQGGPQHLKDLWMSYTYHAQITNDNGQTRDITFNYKHLPIAETISAGSYHKKITREFDSNKNITKEVEKVIQDGIYSVPKVRTFIFDSNNQLLSSTDELGNSMTVTYQVDNPSLPAIETIPVESGKNNVVTHTLSSDKKYNQYSQVSATNASGVTETIKNETVLNADGTPKIERTILNGTAVLLKNYVHSYGITDGNGKLVNRIALSAENTMQNWDAAKVVSKSKVSIAETYDFDAKNGNLLTLKNPTGKIEKYEYDRLKRLTKLVNFDGTFKTITYNNTGNEVTATDEKGIILRKVYDSLGNELRVYGGTASSPELASQKTYDTNGNMITMSDGKSNQTQFQYDSVGRILKSINPDGTFVTIKYQDMYSKIESTNEEGHKTTDSYDLKGNRIKSETADGNGRTITAEWTYTPSGLVKSVKEPSGSTTISTYDELGRLIRIANANGEITKYYYDVFGKMTTLVYPDGKTSQKEYSELGQVLSETDMAGKTAYMSYAIDGSLSKLLDRSQRVQNFTYDPKLRLSTHTGDGFSYTYNYLTNDKLSSVVDTNYGTIGYAYFPNGRLQKKTYPDGKTLEYTYDANGNVTTMKSPFGLVSNMGFNNRNRLTSVVSGGKTFGYEYFSDGMLKTLNYPLTGLKSTYTFDQVNRLKTITNLQGANTINGFTYETDLNGNISKATGDGVVNTYGYDSLNRLKQTAKSPTSKIDFTYDLLGNRATAIGETTFLLASKKSTIAWNGLDQMKSYTNTPAGKPAETTTYQYDYHGFRTKQTGPGGTTQYYTDEAGRVIAEADATGAEKAQIVWAQKPLARIMAGKWYYYIYNGHGDVVKLVDEAGVVKNSYSYDEFGNLTSKTENVINPIRYAGEYQDEESGFYYLRARYYDPVTSRMISRDKHWNGENSIYGDKEYKEGEVRIPDMNAIMQSGNLYTYCNNNPLMYVDPSGNKLEGVQKGYDFMAQIYAEYPGFAKNTYSTLTSYGRRIPDFLNNSVVGEIKNVKYLSYTRQLKGFLEMADRSGGKQIFVLVVNKGATLSKPLMELIQQGRIKLIEVVPNSIKGVKAAPCPFFIIDSDMLNEFKIMTNSIS